MYRSQMQNTRQFVFCRISYYYEEFSLSGMSFYKRFGLIDKLKISKILFTGVYVVPWDYTVPNISMLIKPDIDDYQNIYSHKIYYQAISLAIR